MLQIKFPDGNTKNFEKNISILEVAKSISNSLAKEAVAGRVNGQLKDLCVQIEQDCELEIIKKSEYIKLPPVLIINANNAGQSKRYIPIGLSSLISSKNACALFMGIRKPP